jgi:hypothetical protein
MLGDDRRRRTVRFQAGGDLAMQRAAARPGHVQVAGFARQRMAEGGSPGR